MSSHSPGGKHRDSIDSYLQGRRRSGRYSSPKRERSRTPPAVGVSLQAALREGPSAHVAAPPAASPATAGEGGHGGSGHGRRNRRRGRGKRKGNGQNGTAGGGAQQGGKANAGAESGAGASTEQAAAPPPPTSEQLASLRKELESVRVEKTKQDALLAHIGSVAGDLDSLLGDGNDGTAGGGGEVNSVAAWEARIKQLEERWWAMQQSQEEWRTRASVAAEQVAVMSPGGRAADEASVAEEMEAQRNHIAELQANIVRLERELQQNSDRIDNKLVPKMRAKMEELRAAETKQRSRADAAGNEMQALHARVEAAEREADVQRARADELARTSAALTKQQGELDFLVGELAKATRVASDAAVEERVRQCIHWAREHAKQDEVVAQLRAQVATLEGKVRDAHAHVDTGAAAVEQVRQEHARELQRGTQREHVLRGEMDMLCDVVATGCQSVAAALNMEGVEDARNVGAIGSFFANAAMRVNTVVHDNGNLLAKVESLQHRHNHMLEEKERAERDQLTSVHAARATQDDMEAKDALITSQKGTIAALAEEREEYAAKLAYTQERIRELESEAAALQVRCDEEASAKAAMQEWIWERQQQDEVAKAAAVAEASAAAERAADATAAATEATATHVEEGEAGYTHGEATGVPPQPPLPSAGGGGEALGPMYGIDERAEVLEWKRQRAELEQRVSFLDRRTRELREEKEVALDALRGMVDKMATERYAMEERLRTLEGRFPQLMHATADWEYAAAPTGGDGDASEAGEPPRVDVGAPAIHTVQSAHYVPFSSFNPPPASPLALAPGALAPGSGGGGGDGGGGDSGEQGTVFYDDGEVEEFSTYEEEEGGGGSWLWGLFGSPAPVPRPLQAGALNV